MTKAALGLFNPGFLGRTGSGLVTPPVAGYSMWLAPESPVFSDVGGTTPATANQEVRYWTDLSGAGNHVKYSAGGAALLVQGGVHIASAVNSLRAIRFGEISGGGVAVNTGLITDGNVPLSGGLTVFCVGAYRNPASGGTPNGRTVLGYNSIEFLLRENPAVPRNPSAYHNSSGVQITASGGQIAAGTYFQQTCRFDDAANVLRLWRSSAQIATSADAGATPASGRINIGYTFSLAGNGSYQGDIAELIFYSSALSDGDRALVEAYLITKYAL